MSKIQLQELNQIGYLNNFKCAANDCVDSCCFNWKIDVTKENKEFYEANNAQEILQNIISNSDDVFEIKRCDNGACPQLADDGLCGVQKNFGEEYLPDICYTFPRSYKLINNNHYMTANLACPESLRLMLFNSNFDDFVSWHRVEQNRPKNGLYDLGLNIEQELGTQDVVNIFGSIIAMIDNEYDNSDQSLFKLLNWNCTITIDK